MTSPPPPIEGAITRMLGIRYPILVAPMFLVSTHALVEAAGRAGGMGSIPILNFRTSAAYREFLLGFPKDVPFGVNVVLKWSERLEEDLAATVEHKVPLVITSLGDPTEVVKAVHGYGGKVFSDVISLRHAEKASKAGSDGLVAVSQGAGGHAGPISPFVLGPWLKKELGLPVVLSGALVTGQHLAAALALGADAGYYGTRFIATPESAATEAYRQALVSASPEDVELTSEVTGVPANFLKSSLARFREGGKKAWKDTWSAGQGVAFIQGVRGTHELVQEIAREYHATIAALPR